MPKVKTPDKLAALSYLAIIYSDKGPNKLNVRLKEKNNDDSCENYR